MLRGKYGIVIVDMQPAFLDGCSNAEKSCLISNVNALVKFGKSKSLPIWALEMSSVGKTVLEVRSGLEGYFGVNFVSKKFASGFKHTSLDGSLKGFSVRNLVYAGLCKGVCVKETIADGEARYSPFISLDLTGVDDSENRWYESHTNYFPTYRELVAFLDKEVSR